MAKYVPPHRRSGGSKSKSNNDNQFKINAKAKDLTHIIENLSALNVAVCRLNEKKCSDDKKSGNENKSAESDEKKSSASNENENKFVESDEMKCLELFCANCKPLCRLKWPLLSSSDADDRNNFDYSENLVLYSAKRPSRNRTPGRMNARDMLYDSNQSECRHKIGYGSIWCRHCGRNVTANFNPKIWKCPNKKCATDITRAMGRVACIN
eukprot:UN02725